MRRFLVFFGIQQTALPRGRAWSRTALPRESASYSFKIGSNLIGVAPHARHCTALPRGKRLRQYSEPMLSTSSLKLQARPKQAKGSGGLFACCAKGAPPEDDAAATPRSKDECPQHRPRLQNRPPPPAPPAPRHRHCSMISLLLG